MQQGIIRALILVGASIVGYAASSYQSSRWQLKDEINDYQREILIASRLLQQYADSCQKIPHDHFSPYVEHATSRYVQLVNRASQFPYFVGKPFIDNNQASIFEFQQKIKDSHSAVTLCHGANK